MIFVRRNVLKNVVTKTNSYVATSYETYRIATGQETAAGQAVGKSHETTIVMENVGSSGSGVKGRIDFFFENVSIPNDATNIRVNFKAKGGLESTSEGGVDFAVWWNTGSTKRRISDYYSFSTRSSAVVGISEISNESLKSNADVYDVTPRDVAMNLFARFEVQYYGGHVDGMTLKISYDVEE